MKASLKKIIIFFTTRSKITANLCKTSGIWCNNLYLILKSACFSRFTCKSQNNYLFLPQKTRIENMDRLYTTNISSVDALWALIQGQTQSVKDALYKRMEEANRQRKTLQQQQYVSKSLKRAFAELEEARTANMELPDATDLFKLINKQ